MSRLAVMQPYFFPYIGYWQLIHAVDRFVIYDDVNYIKGGWINRNRLLINGEPVFFTAPLQQASPYKRICDTSLQPAPLWRDKLVKTVATTYRKAACFAEVFPVVEQLIRHETNTLSEYLANQLQTLAAFMGIKTEFVLSSSCYENADLSGQARVLDICKKEDASNYINLQGGQTLYAGDAFRSAGLDLRFIVMQPVFYQQRADSFVPYLSIIDALMAVGPMAIRQHLDAFHLVSPRNNPMHVSAGERDA
ncbi:WbqC-like protein family protein [Polaromonas sp. OV174]|uniref:WbqC family protein n=1 Tax=Polaromonas sp. OV174 TaxID=1855300 RepID=UPI0008E6BAB6|nr:WbqC family protein [Polaromonas sp. OV174]SFC69725.1 WbqC-like protein family protein [Polaromonas sp. OV174]